jgi:hypothetical protein
MFDFTRLSPGLDLAAGPNTLSVWVAGIAAAAVIGGIFLVMLRVGPGPVIGSIAGFGLLAVIGATLQSFSNRLDRDQERGSLDQRMLQLTASVFAPGSALGCLDANFSETVADSCEKLIFGSPDMVSTAFAYVSARLSLLTDGLTFANRRDAGYEATLVLLRQSIEADRFGFVAQVLATREGCNFARCDALALLRDAEHIRSNLNSHTFDELLARNSSNWPQHGQIEKPVAAAGRPLAKDWNFPSSSSIPPLSIMTEPAQTSEQSAAAKAPRQPGAPRTAQPRTQPTNPPPPPVQLGPTSTNDNATRGQFDPH